MGSSWSALFSFPLLTLAVGGDLRRGVALGIGLFALIKLAQLPRKVKNLPRGGAVVVTGASTGIGRAAAQALAAQGFTVLAGVRKAQDGEPLKAVGCIPLILDVATDESVAAAAKTTRGILAAEKIPLVAIVNNAGLADSALPLELYTIGKIDQVIQVNVYGICRMYREFVPIMRDTSSVGRIVNIGSVLGHLDVPQNSPYCMSKRAVEAITGVSRVELAPFGITVSVLNPGYVRTEIANKGVASRRKDFETLRASFPVEYHSLYPKIFDRDLFEAALERSTRIFNSCPTPDVSTTPAIVHALTSSRPRAEYICGSLNPSGGFPSAKLGLWANSFLPSELKVRFTAVAKRESKKKD